jgi:hypothetical protein
MNDPGKSTQLESFLRNSVQIASDAKLKRSQPIVGTNDSMP